MAEGNALSQQIQAAPGLADGAIHHQTPGQGRQSLQQFGGFIHAPVPPDPAGQVRRDQLLQHRQALGHGSHAPAQDHDIATGIVVGSPLLRQWAVGGHHRLQLLVRGQGGRQGDQSPGLVGADRAVDELPAQILRLVLTGLLSQGPGHLGCGGRRPGGEPQFTARPPGGREQFIVQQTA